MGQAEKESGFCHSAVDMGVCGACEIVRQHVQENEHTCVGLGMDIHRRMTKTGKASYTAVFTY